jgi:hypothetical protein
LKRVGRVGLRQTEPDEGGLLRDEGGLLR